MLSLALNVKPWMLMGPGKDLGKGWRSACRRAAQMARSTWGVSRGGLLELSDMAGEKQRAQRDKQTQGESRLAQARFAQRDSLLRQTVMLVHATRQTRLAPLGRRVGRGGARRAN